MEIQGETKSFGIQKKVLPRKTSTPSMVSIWSSTLPANPLQIPAGARRSKKKFERVGWIRRRFFRRLLRVFGRNLGHCSVLRQREFMGAAGLRQSTRVALTDRIFSQMFVRS